MLLSPCVVLCCALYLSLRYISPDCSYHNMKHTIIQHDIPHRSFIHTRHHQVRLLNSIPLTVTNPHSITLQLSHSLS